MRDANLDTTLPFSRLNTKPAIAVPGTVWQAFASDRWAYSLAHPNDYDYSKDKEADYFAAPSFGLVSVARIDATGYTLDELAQADVAAT